MDTLLSLLRTVAPALATVVAGPMGGAAVSLIAQKLGVEDTVEAVARAVAGDPDASLKLAEIDLSRFQAEQAAITSRWQADMASDSWLSKNIRPMTLIYLLSAYLVMALADGMGFKIAEAYVTLLGQWGMLVMAAYFSGRSVEKIISMVRK